MRKPFCQLLKGMAGFMLVILTEANAQPFCPPPGGNSCTLLPDIIAGKKTLNSTNGWSEYSQVITGINRGLLRIDVATPNVGWGPLEIQSTNNYLCGTDTLFNFFPPPNFLCPDGSYPKRLIKQNVFNRVNGITNITQRDAGWMEYHPAHGHIHIEGWGMYTLRLKDASILTDTLQWPIVTRGIKVSFCLIDLTTCSSSLGDCVDANGNVLTNASFPNYGLAGPYNSCGDVKQGISVGKVDVYSRSLDESFVRIPYEACNGNYFVMVEVDPDDHFQEINENNNWLAAQIPLSQQRTSNTGPYSYIFSNQGNHFCGNSSMTLTASGANSYLWNTGATSQNIVINQPGQYWVRATTPCGTTTSDTLTITKYGTTSEPSITVQDTVCNGEIANLYASGNAKWYDAATGGNHIYSGNNFQTGTLNSSTTYYVEDEPVNLSGVVGANGPSYLPLGNFSGASREFLVFNAFMPFTLKKVTVNAEVAGTRIIQLRNLYNKIIAQKTIALVAGVQEISLDFAVPAGMNHQLGLGSSTPVARLYMNAASTTNAGYPFKLKSVANIVGSSMGDAFYPYFYNWKIETAVPGCMTRLRKAVTAVVVPRPNVQITGLQPTYLHTDPPVQLTGTPSGGILSGTGLIGDVFHPRLNGVGTYTFRYDYSDPYCPGSDSKTVVVSFNEDRMKDGFDVRMFNTPGSNPVLQVTTYQASALSLRLVNSGGQLMRQWNLQAGQGTNMYPIGLEKFAKGVYSLEVYHSAAGKSKVFQLMN
jgi:hypothetical protein